MIKKSRACVAHQGGVLVGVVEQAHARKVLARDCRERTDLESMACEYGVSSLGKRGNREDRREERKKNKKLGLYYIVYMAFMLYRELHVVRQVACPEQIQKRAVPTYLPR
jgi:hypothetical protein